MADDTLRENERHARQLERLLRCLNIPLAEDVAALEAGIQALRLIARVRAERETPPLEVSIEQMDVLYRQKHDMWAAAITRAEKAEADLAAVRAEQTVTASTGKPGTVGEHLTSGNAKKER